LAQVSRLQLTKAFPLLAKFLVTAACVHHALLPSPSVC